MGVFRYKVINVQTALSETKLNEFGRRGYELTGVVRCEYGYEYYFKITEK